ncbi:MAG TPA: metalloregulator ArsR/SmtB family transcription factor [Methanoregulaceae archaeon]|nr:metalloregulator ArsR/SmtB family transcription factor [Methanoregulaceae archaeon]
MRLHEEGVGETKMAVPDDLRQVIEGAGGAEVLRAQLPDPERIRTDSRLFHTLSDPLRLSILFLLQSRPLCVSVIKEVLRVPDSKLSYHLSVLQSMRLIQGERQANWIIYHETPLGRRIVSRIEELSRTEREFQPPEASSAEI